MSHIHIPDGVLPVWLWLVGYLVTGVLVGILWRWGRATAEPRKFALLGIFTAIMVLVMMIEIPPLSYHFNLSVVTGIVLGPQLSILAALMVNVILALVGHGGITVIGLNTLLLSVEMLAGYYTFRLFLRMHLRIAQAGFAATIFGLITGTAAGFGVIAAGSSWIDHFLRSATPKEDLGPGIEGAYLNLTRLAVIMFGVGIIGWVFEGILTAAILAYLVKAYPGLIEGVQSTRENP